MRRRKAARGRAVTLCQDGPAAQLETALLRHRTGDVRAAESIYLGILGNAPHHPDAWHLAGVAALQRGDPDTALQRIRQAVSIRPKNADFHLNLGHAHQLLRQPEQAEACFRQALRLQPRLAAAHARLGDLYRDAERWHESIVSYDRALRLEPVDATVWLNRGVVHRQAGELHEAEECYRQAIRLQPAMPEAYANLGSVLRARGQSAAAVKELEHAVRLNPHGAESHYNLANALTDCGKFVDARHHYRQSLELRPGAPHVLYNLAQIEKFEPGGQTLADLERLAASDRAWSDADGAYLHFALGKAYDDLRRFSEAFAHFSRGNSLARPPFDRRAHAEFIDRMIAAFPPGWIAERAHWGDSRTQPVFIVGMPRSGTTLVEQVLARHPQVAAGGERSEIQQLADWLGGRFPDSPPYPECAGLLDEATVTTMLRSYIAGVACGNQSAFRFTDKMPTNFLHLGLIAILFPTATIIHCRRDPRDVCLSCYLQHFERRLPFAYDLCDLAAYYQDYERLMAHWRRASPVQAVEIQYEDLVRSHESTARRLVEACGLDWDVRCLEFHRSDATVRTASHWQVRQPLYRTSLARWRNYRDWIGPLLDAFGDDEP